MTTSRPFTTIAALIFLIMGIAHAYRLVTDFPVTVGGSTIPYAVSWAALALTLLMSAMLYREARR